MTTSSTSPAIETRDLNLYYGSFQALIDVNMVIQPRRITGLIGPSGCGKSTLLRSLNRMNDLIPNVRVYGEIRVFDHNVCDDKTDLVGLRKRVGMVFQRPNPFPLSIYENVVFAARVHKTAKGSDFDDVVERCLSSVLLWEDLKDRLGKSALELSLEQQQRLCIARLLAVMPDILLMDEPCSAMDPASTQGLEELIARLKEEYTIVIVTHNMQQAARVSDDCGFMLLGEMVEFRLTDEMFKIPQDERTRDYVTGRYG
ncbi:MAG: phosphate ABC transporter ATP-binding protein [Armatimonadetes bacterium CG2_30_59_28]|nr:phosphate ABC transporter ATP-binding protein [Armatimonadota bacterium]OIO96990.1 MAG: phosphate ABC transporter ATP-binding protein [Armatimonadetes bacterium CG2_30_59_28]PIU64227.1 MAG: phosphate ABC transporter ATP-binding protein [Armatimonadetes bacterium CG07_land_8_20_14_0_80_59_28]PIX44296.1 MAG: phosphate ABC transporter ATP-binding protein [Armatimonadetes bacterium CG_4_8_14_3_um_filter_58_9]PIY49021.1 MAG: phosphate ABC transporter ATP-binding protein [Armatimonadetes bacterium